MTDNPSPSPSPALPISTSKDEEMVLVVPTDLFRQIGYFQGFSRATSLYQDKLLHNDALQFLKRGIAEKDPNFKQLIPYMFFCHTTPSTGEVSIFTYVRGKGMGEQRLHSKMSIGIGGHLNYLDQQQDSSNGLCGSGYESLYQVGMNRERNEEVRVETTCQEQCVGLINDDLTEVGQVHLGIVHRFDVLEPHVYPLETDLIESGFRPLSELLTILKEDPNRFESWTAITLEALFC